MAFIHADFLLESEPARQLFHNHAADQPILDYHTHLSAQQIASDRRFGNLFDIWLEGDHYKWRLMRANGVPERFCTGDATPYEKFLAWAATVPKTLRNPLYHWTHLELARYFDIHDLLDQHSAASIWKRANAQLVGEGLSVRGILRRFHVQALCTTDDPTDDLAPHRDIAASGFSCRVFPTFRPDKALRVDHPSLFQSWLEKLAGSATLKITNFSDFLDALNQRHDFFHRSGCRLSDHALVQCPTDFCSEAVAAGIFDRAREGTAASAAEHAQFASFMMVFFGRLDAQRGWTKQLHLGALRNASSRAFRSLGPDTGFDGMGDRPQMQALATYLDCLEQQDALPRIILYNADPRDNYGFATLAGSFQSGNNGNGTGNPLGRIQFGSAWWFLDQKEGMEWQLNALSSTGLLANFIGMLTDSRSFMSFPRHEYFRRVLCNLVGADVDRGLIPAKPNLAGSLVENICYRNAREYLQLDVPGAGNTTELAEAALHSD